MVGVTRMKAIYFLISLTVLLAWYSISLMFRNGDDTFQPSRTSTEFIQSVSYDGEQLQLSWKEYVESNPDLAKVVLNQKDAVNHFTKHGQFEKRPTKTIPDVVSWTETTRKLKKMIIEYDSHDLPITQRNLIIFHVGEANANSSLDVAVNNLIIFTSSIHNHTTKANQQAVYLFNVIGGEDNPLLQFIPSYLRNVAVVQWRRASSDMLTHIRTVHLLGSEITSQFKAVVFLNQGVRGPLTRRNNGDWLAEYRRLLDLNNVGIVGSTISCESTPHVQTHIFAMHTELFIKATRLIDSGPRAKTWLGIVAQYEVGLSTTLLSQGYNISSVLYDQRMKTSYFNGTCIPVERKGADLLNPTSWCDIKAEEVMFMKWGGEPLRINGYMCEEAVTYMVDTLKNLATTAVISRSVTADTNEVNGGAALSSKEVVAVGGHTVTSAGRLGGLIVPETLIGGRLYDLYREYNQEMWLDQSTFRSNNDNRSSVTVKTNTANVTGDRSSAASRSESVCFLVRTYDTSKAVNQSKFIHYGLPDLIQSLLRQSDPRWIAVFFNTDRPSEDSMFETQLQATLRAYRDDRLRYVEVPKEKRPQFTPSDAGYTATDYVLRLVSSSSSGYTQCKYISVTNGDNIYGSQVVSRVLMADRVPTTTDVRLTQQHAYDMILNPLDSRNFADQDYVYRNEVRDWTKRCIGIHSMLLFNRLAYTSQPIPVVGGVDLASVFLNRKRFVDTDIYFSDFTDPVRYPCAGCQDGYFTEYLVRNRLWTYKRLAIDGLNSIIFHGPSPTWCIASGNVWFDHPQVNSVGCYRHSVVRGLLDDPAVQSHYDWHHHYHADRLCLRLNEKGFKLATNSDRRDKKHE